MSDKAIAGRGVDHLVLCVQDLDAAATFYEKLGFTVTPRAMHPWGTANQLVQLHGSFLEIIEVADPSKLNPSQPGRFDFGRYIARMLMHREGFGMLVFESSNADADRQEFAEKGLSDFPRFDFQRQAKLPGGEEVTVGFSLAFIVPPGMSDAAMFVCQQHAPQYFWKPEYQTHPNGAEGIGEVILIAPEPAGLRSVFERVQGVDAVQEEYGMLRCETARGLITVMTPDDFADWFGADALPAPSPEVAGVTAPHFAAFRITVSDLAATEAKLADQNIPAQWQRAGLTIPASSLFGVTLSFVQGAAPQGVDNVDKTAALPLLGPAGA